MQSTVISLAEAMKHKYSLYALAASLENLVAEAKTDIVKAFRLHVSEKAKEPAILLVALQYKEPWSKKFVNIITNLVAKIDELPPEEIFKQTNQLLGMISEYKTDPNNKVRNFIHDSVSISKESDKKYREHVKSKFETAIKGMSGLLEKAVLKLKVFNPLDELAGGAVDPKRKELSKEKIRMFMFTPVAVDFGLNDMSIMNRILDDYHLRQKLTTIINAIDRGHKPADGPDMRLAVAELAESAKIKSSTNAEFFEHGTEPAAELGPDEILAHQQAEKEEEQVAQLAEQQEKERLAPQIKKRDELARQKGLEHDWEHHVRSEGVLKLLDKLVLKGTYENR